MNTPPVDLLDHSLRTENGAEAPLHLQVRQALRGLIDDHFDDGQQFWTEGVLIERLGVSRITVRRALDDLTREGMLARYRARGTFVRKSDGAPEAEPTRAAPPHIGVFLPDGDSPFLSGLLEQVGLVGEQEHMRLSIFPYRRGQSGAHSVQRVGFGPDEISILLLGLQFNAVQEVYDALREASYRVVCVDTPVKGGPYVGVDNQEGMRLGIEHLEELGHRRIAFIATGTMKHPSMQDRMHYFKRICLEREIEGHVVDAEVKEEESSYTATLKVMGQVQELGVSAVFTGTDCGAWAALKWFRDNDIRVPEQISVLSYGDERPSAHTHPALSSVAIPPDGIARAALETLRSPDLHSTFWPARALVRPRLVGRESTAVVRG